MGGAVPGYGSPSEREEEKAAWLQLARWELAEQVSNPNQGDQQTQQHPSKGKPDSR
jgi:hypothetical protein